MPAVSETVPDGPVPAVPHPTGVDPTGAAPAGAALTRAGCGSAGTDSRRSRPAGRGIAILLALLGGLGLLLANAAPARAAAEERMDRFDADYRLDTDGVLHVTETIVWRFGDNSGRHGILRSLLVREPDTDDDDQDISYDISTPKVSSPDDGVSTQIDGTTEKYDGGRLVYRNYRIGDPDQTIAAPTATYVLTYTVRGAVRGSSDYDELYWDVTGSDNPTKIQRSTVNAQVPGGAREVACYAGLSGSTSHCSKAKIDDGVARFANGSLQPGEDLTIAVKVAPGLVSDNRLHTELAADEQRARTAEMIIAICGGAVIVLALVLGGIAVIRIGRDQRYLDLPPGTLPDRKDQGRTGNAPLRTQVPVRFEPPDLSAASAGILRSGQVRPRDAAATLVGLAVDGAITIQPTDEKGFSRRRYEIELIDATRAGDPAEEAMLTGIFGKKGSSYVKAELERTGQTLKRQTARFSQEGRFKTAYSDFERTVRSSASTNNWFSSSVPKSQGPGWGWLGTAVVLAVIVAGLASAIAWPVLLVGVPLVVVLLVVFFTRLRRRRGSRSARGTAWLDQINGFRDYLATAEADQLQFEEGEDIYSRYLPWAIALGLADRWAAVCRPLAEQGRIPTRSDWYVGAELATFDAALFSSGTASAAGVTSSGTSINGGGGGTGGGAGTGSSSSSFSGGGGSAGGGGGGGGTSGW